MVFLGMDQKPVKKNILGYNSVIEWLGLYRADLYYNSYKFE